MRRFSSRVSLVAAFILLWAAGLVFAAQPLPDGFVYLDTDRAGIQLDLRYFGEDNFVGQRVDGYEGPRCILTAQAAEAVLKVQEELRPFGLSLKIFDAYRPQRAVDHFVRWARDLNDTTMKGSYYPEVRKEELFDKGYIAERSGHTRGSTVDVTLGVAENNGFRELDMGTGFDFFGPQSWPLDQTMEPEQRANRLLLRQIMTKYGFKPYDQEWWHFTLKDEPFPDTYFEFPVR